MALINCPECNKEVSDKAETCIHCGFPILKHIESQKRKSNGIYRRTLKGQRKVYCPRCDSDNCEWITETKVIPGKTKKETTLNLNPLKPFTIFNHKEKVVRRDMEYTVKRIQCYDCGNIFY